MKIKSDFITNSSSTSYIIIDKNKTPIDMQDLILTWCKENEIWIDPDMQYSETFMPHEITEFQIFCNFGKELDWIEKIVGLRCSRLNDTEAYNISLNHLREGTSIHFYVLDRNVSMEDMIVYIDNLEVVYSDGGW